MALGRTSARWLAGDGVQKVDLALVRRRPDGAYTPACGRPPRRVSAPPAGHQCLQGPSDRPARAPGRRAPLAPQSTAWPRPAPGARRSSGRRGRSGRMPGCPPLVTGPRAARAGAPVPATRRARTACRRSARQSTHGWPGSAGPRASGTGPPHPPRACARRRPRPALAGAPTGAPVPGPRTGRPLPRAQSPHHSYCAFPAPSFPRSTSARSSSDL